MEESSKPSDKSFFLTEGVEKGGESCIESRFETLIESKKDKPFNWYKELDLDKSYASKIRRGLIIPPEWLRIRIASYFDCDTSVLWKAEEIWLAEQCEVDGE